jgi:hypothetical protein
MMQQQMTWNLDYSNCLFSNGNGSGNGKFFEAIEQALPTVFSRQVAAKAVGGLISAKSFSNLDARLEGPPVKVRVGGKVGYERESFMQWLKARMRTV